MTASRFFTTASTSNIILASHADFNISTRSICGWGMNIQDSGTYRVLAMHGVWNEPGVYALFINKSTTPDLFEFRHREDAGAARVVQIAANMDIDDWYFCGGTKTGTTATVFKYENSSNTTTTQSESSEDASNSGQDQITIGENKSGSEDWLGYISWVMVFNRVLSNAEFQELQWNPMAITSGNVVKLPIWGDATELDITGNAHNGTVDGATTATIGPPIFLLGGQ
ncbi:MAG: LamG-like jellyroll fold domain-containing protein [Candidatus Thorarchaeota archaeon]